MIADAANWQNKKPVDQDGLTRDISSGFTTDITLTTPGSHLYAHMSIQASRNTVSGVAKRCIKRLLIHAYCHGWGNHRMIVCVFH